MDEDNISQNGANAEENFYKTSFGKILPVLIPSENLIIIISRAGEPNLMEVAVFKRTNNPVPILIGMATSRDCDVELFYALNHFENATIVDMPYVMHPTEIMNLAGEINNNMNNRN